ncbi:caspase family protein [Bacteroidetes/Chlorobi group bacterium ChocPot_Mid]|nr:MAG: caspase family protein [Bacteroidetes/Chlorobi group bacterium ChocPot_Mid]
MKNLKTLLLIIILLGIISSNFVHSESFEVNVNGNNIKLYENSYALIIGLSKYANGWRELPGVKKDVDIIKNVLENQGFTVHFFENLNSNELKFAIIDFINKYGLNEKNRLLFYFAGHDYTIKKSYGEEMGYFVPVDAPDPNIDKEGFLTKALPMMEFEIFARMIDAKHALFLFDACFSGSVFQITRSIYEPLTEKVNEPVRQFISSGSANETVPDQSIFREQFVNAIEGDADANKDSLISASELGAYLYKMVSFYSYDTQHPQYGKIRNSKLDKGDFIFSFKKSYEIPSTYQSKILHSGYKPLTGESQNKGIDLDSCYVELFNTFNQSEAQALFSLLVNEGLKNIFVESLIDYERHKTNYIVRSISFDNVINAVKFKSNPVFRKREVEDMMMKIPPKINCSPKK